MQAPDAQYPQYFREMTTTNVSTGGLLHLAEPDPGWRVPADCGEATYPRPDGSVVDLNCDGLKHALYRDLDGTLLGALVAAETTSSQESASAARAANSTIVGAWAQPRHVSGIDQGAPLEVGTCSHAPDHSGYVCGTPGAQGNVSLASGYAQPVAPAAGLFGAPELLVLESRDKDSEDRNFAPVELESNGVPAHVSLCLARMLSSQTIVMDHSVVCRHEWNP